jgi:hypothetical protein
MSIDLFSDFGDRVQRRLDQVLRNEQCKWPATHDERELLHALSGKRGPRFAVERSYLVSRLKLNDRAIRDMVHNLRLNFGVQIGASRVEGGGYYLMNDEADALAASEQMIRQGVATIRAGIAMRGGRHDEVELLGQISLALNQGGN